MTANEQRLLDLIETDVPKRYRPRFKRFVDTNDDDVLTGTIADLVAGGAVTAALRAMGDSRLATIAVILAARFKTSYLEFVSVARSEEFLNSVQSLLAKNSVEEAVNMIDGPLTKLVDAMQDGYSVAGKALAGDFSSMLEGIRPSNLTITFQNVAPEIRNAETSVTHTVYTIRDVADQVKASEAQIKATKTATDAALWDAKEARLAAERATKSIQAALEAAARIRSVPGDVTGAISNSAKAAIQAAEDAAKLAQTAQAMSNTSPVEAAETARRAAQAAQNAAAEAQAAKQAAVDVENVARGLRPSVGISFDPTNPRAAQNARDMTFEFIREVTEEQRDAVRQAVTKALSDGEGPKAAARAYRDSIGLTKTQRDAVDNYRRLLETGSREAFDRALADNRYGPRSKDPDAQQKYLDKLTPEQIDTMVDRYRDRYVNYRADTIARTESTTALSMANHEAMQQTIDLAGIDEDDVEKRWNATHDGRTRASHWATDKQVVRGINTPFITGLRNQLQYPGDLRAPAADRVNCRCVCSYRIV